MKSAGSISLGTVALCLGLVTAIAAQQPAAPKPASKIPAPTAGMDVTALFETSGDDQFSGFGAEFHFDTANQTLYFSADGTQGAAIVVAQVQAGVVLNPHDLLIV